MTTVDLFCLLVIARVLTGTQICLQEASYERSVKDAYALFDSIAAFLRLRSSSFNESFNMIQLFFGNTN